ncbi:MAG: GNAT family N-acetyltransferase [Actinomycetota bacterium]|nr:GNAT family N-acetyltransferase [Actinomycetota bacterium]
MRDRRAFGAWRDLSGEGLVLRRWRPDDRAALTAGAGDPETARWVPVAVPFTDEAARWTLEEQYPRRWVEGTCADLAVVEDGQVVGYVALIPRGPRAAPELGWWTAPSARGRGVAGRAARLVADWASTLGWTRVEAHVDVDNLGSQRAASKAGMSREGLLRAAGHDREGRARDLVLFARVIETLPDGAPEQSRSVR